MGSGGEWRKLFWANTLSSYVALGTRILTGIMTFRLLYSSFTEAEFGFWALLWSLLGFGILLDFGFGFTAQKNVAEGTATGDLDRTNRLLSTIFWTYVVLAGLIAAAAFALQDVALTILNVPHADRGEFGRAFLVFSFGLAAMFPLGLFPEVMRGLHRIYLVNLVWAFNSVVIYIVLSWGIARSWSFSDLMLAVVCVQQAPNILCLLLSRWMLPGLSLSPRLWSWRHLAPQLHFSFAAYLISCSNIVIANGDQFVTTMTLGVASVAIYQAGFKVAEMLQMFARQLHIALSPAASNLHALDDRNGLRTLMLNMSRMMFRLLTPCYVLGLFYLEEIIALLTDQDPISTESYAVGAILLTAIYVNHLFGGTARRILMMCGYERRLLWISLSEVTANIVLSVIFVRFFGVAGVALGTLVAGSATAMFCVFPMAIRFLGITPLRVAAFHLQGSMVSFAIFGATMACMLGLVPLHGQAGFFDLAWRGAIAMVPVLLMNWKVLRTVAAA